MRRDLEAERADAPAKCLGVDQALGHIRPGGPAISQGGAPLPDPSLRMPRTYRSIEPRCVEPDPSTGWDGPVRPAIESYVAAEVLPYVSDPGWTSTRPSWATRSH